MKRAFALLSPLLLAAVWFGAVGPQSLGGPAVYISVFGHSMEPMLHTGDLAWVRRQSDYKVGDVIAFRAESGNVIHRIIGGNAIDGFDMQGDNRDMADPWRPTGDQVLGKMFFHIPGLAGRLQALRQGPAFSALVVLAVVASVPGAEVVRRRRRRGRNMQHTPSNASNQPPSRLLQGPPEPAGPRPRLAARLEGGPRTLAGIGGIGPLAEAPRTVVLAFFATGVVALLAVLLGVYAFRQTPMQSRMQPRVQFTQSGAFDYRIQVAPAAIYPGGSVGPLPGAEGKDAAASEQAVYTRLAQAIDIQYHYALESRESSELRGTVRTDLEVRAAEGWTKTDPLTPPTAFEGSEVNASARIDMHALMAQLDQIEKETGFEARAYDVIVKPVISIQGRVGGEPVQETFASSLAIRVDPTRVAPQGALVRSVPTQRADMVTSPRMIGLGTWQAQVEQVRLASVATAVGMGMLTALLASVIFLGLGRSEEAKIRARYGSLLLQVQAAEDDTVRDRVRVVSMRDLARLARRDGGLIMEESDRLGPRYSVRDGDTVYEFVPEAHRNRQRFAEFVARPEAPEPGAAAGHE